jgi:predicted membrane metal-binding protein
LSAHEPTVSHRKVAAGSNRTFGLVFAVVFAIIALWPVISGTRPRLWAAVIAAALLAVAVFAPRLLSPLNRAWFHVGMALHRVVNPVVMGVIYFGTVVPVGLIMKLRGMDPLRLKRDPEAASYWVVREPPGPERGSMTKQF